MAKAARFGLRLRCAAARNGSGGRGSEIGSSTRQPLIASRNKAASSTLRAIGPSTERSLKRCSPGPLATRPGLGRKPTTEQKLAGVRKLPPRSEPLASATMPVASAAAEPPDEPAALSAGFHGLRVSPNTSLKVLAPAPNSGVLVID